VSNERDHSAGQAVIDRFVAAFEAGTVSLPAVVRLRCGTKKHHPMGHVGAWLTTPTDPHTILIGPDKRWIRGGPVWWVSVDARPGQVYGGTIVVRCPNAACAYQREWLYPTLGVLIIAAVLTGRNDIPLPG